MFSFDHFARVAVAAAGALILSTMSIAAAVGPGHSVASAPVASAFASVHNGVAAHG